MNHINYNRNINQIYNTSVQKVLSHSSHNNNFGAFGGNSYQRNMIGLHEISYCLGNKGIVLIHNDPQFVLGLGNIYNINKNTHNNQVNMYLANPNGNINSYYDPLYGLSKGNVLDVIAPLSGNGFPNYETTSLRSILTDYLDIMQYYFNLNNSAFGEFPFNLDLLLELTQMPFSELYETVLQFLPQDSFKGISQRLSSVNAQQNAFDAVRSFASTLSTSLWTQKGFKSHSRLSIISAVKNKQLISIYVPTSRKEILDYLASELNTLNENSIPYLLVASGISINESNDFKKLFLTDHIHLPYSTGILAEDLSNIVSLNSSSDNINGELSSLFTQTQEMFIFSCSSILSALPFTNSIGNYYRLKSETSLSTQRNPFHIFSSHSYATSQQETQQAVVNPEELTTLNDGCLLMGSNYNTPTLIKHFTF